MPGTRWRAPGSVLSAPVQRIARDLAILPAASADRLARVMSLALWSLFVGGLLVTMVLAGTLLGRLPLSSAMVYLALGWLLGPDGIDVLRPDPVAHAGVLERLAEVALLISLFAVGLQLGVPLRDRRWWHSIFEYAGPRSAVALM
jgi:NhaP-type Na+/H+ or K+/H+ antiporter